MGYHLREGKLAQTGQDLVEVRNQYRGHTVNYLCATKPVALLSCTWVGTGPTAVLGLVLRGGFTVIIRGGIY